MLIVAFRQCRCMLALLRDASMAHRQVASISHALLDEPAVAPSAIGPRTDVYGLGATLYAMLCGRPPFVGRDAPDVLAQIVSSRPPQPPSLSNSDVSAWLDAIVLRCLAKEPGERFESVAALLSVVRGKIGNPTHSPLVRQEKSE